MTGTSSPWLSRRALLTSAAVATACGVVALPRPAAAKMSQKAALYQDTPKGDQRCATCTLLQADGGCKIVDGTVQPDGWCKFFVLKHV